MADQQVERAIEEYRGKYPLYEDYETRVRALLETLLEAEELRVHTVTSRTKSVDSLRVKLGRRTRDDEAPFVTDLVGVRIITYFSDEVDRIGTLIEREFEVNREHSIDKRKTLDPDRFGYLSLHYICTLSAERQRLMEYRRFGREFCEIQVRTVLQHAWAEIEHDLGYKSAAGVPDVIRRRFSRLAGLLELADNEFLDIRNQLQTYADSVRTDIERAPNAVAVDAVSIQSMVEHDPLVRSIDQELVGKGTLVDLQGKDLPSLAQRLRGAGLETVQQVRSALERERAVIVSQWSKYLNGVGGTRPDQLVRGASLFRLAVVIASMTGGAEKIKATGFAEGVDEPERTRRVEALHRSIQDTLKEVRG